MQFNTQQSRGQTKVDLTFAKLYTIIRNRIEYYDSIRSDPDAFCQAVCVQIEKEMGIFPNVGKLTPNEDDISRV